MKILNIAILAALVFFSFAHVTSAVAVDASVEKSADGWINWDRQVVKAVGHGVLPGDIDNPAQALLMARAAAMSDAYRNLAMMVYGVRVTGETRVKNFVTQKDEVRTRVQGFIHGAEVVSEKELSDRSYEVILKIPLTGKSSLMKELSAEILPADGRPETEGSGECTGLIVDARGLSVKPAMSPKICDEDGAEVYGTLMVSPDFAIETGIASYPQSLSAALKSTRAGSSPMVVTAVGRGPKYDCDVIVSKKDAVRIREMDARTGMLSRCRVEILIGK